MPDEKIERLLPPGDFQRIVLEEARRLLAAAKLAKEVERGDGFVRRDATVLIRHSTLEELVQAIVAAWAAAARDFPELKDLYARTTALAAETVAAQRPASLIGIFAELVKLHGILDKGASDGFQLEPLEESVKFSASGSGDDSDGFPLEALLSDRDDQAFLAAVGNMLAASRRESRKLSQDEVAAVSAAYRLLDRGVQLPPAYQGIGVYGFRKHQTSLSLANPGEGHLTVTCAHLDLLDGTVVHIEHIDRDGVDDREVVEPYRLPASLSAARVRLHTGRVAPCTAYIGRPAFENGIQTRQESAILRATAFDRDLLKTVHSVASACTAMFMNGVADCKIAIERMSYVEAVLFMRAVVGNVVRDPTRQYLSAAFNINLPIWDDRAGTGRAVTERLDIARLGIELAVAGRFDKVTWDGASNEVPSKPIIEQIPLRDWVQLIHEAHERGLETYVSAGMNASHMPACVFTGVDGVGIGTSLHYRHPATKAIGQLKPEAIREVLVKRDEAAVAGLGRGARMLARLDRMFFEGTLPKRLDGLRHALLGALRDGKSEEVEALLAQIQIPVDGSPRTHPLFAQAQRLIDTLGQEPVGLERLGREQWKARVDLAERLLAARDLTGLKEVFA
jgi:hypothetical protein